MPTLLRHLGPSLALATLPLLAVSSGSAEPLPEQAEMVAEYEIRVRLDPEARRLFGEQRVVWHNPSEDLVGDLWLHLDLNAFRNSKSTFYREPGGRVGRGGAAEDGWGGIDITAIHTSEGVDLSRATSFEHPDDDNADDRTVLRVRLPEAVAPGASVALDLTWEARLPGAFVRTGFVREFYLVGQWFPRLGVYEPAGRRGRKEGGWTCHQFHPQSEFYSDFGRYHVEITVPDRFVVGATGQRIDRRANGDGTSTHVYQQADVHHFAWTADPGFTEIRRTFDADVDVTPEEYAEAARLLGRSLEEVHLQDVEIVLLLQPVHAPQAERHLRAAAAAIKWYGLWFGRYPYATLTVVDPAPGGWGSYGMEYPTFITAGTVFLVNSWPLDGILMPEEVVLHEVAHQYWQGMVASNEYEEPWLDEGFSTWSAARASVKEYGGVVARAFGLQLGRMEGLRSANRASRDFAPVRGPAWHVSADYRFDIYTRTALTLETLEGLLGETTMARVMRTYHERWRFKHPSSEDFYAVASEVSGRDLRPFFEQTIEQPGFLDYELTSAHTVPDRAPRGILEDGAAATLSLPEAEAADEEAEGPWRSQVTLRRRGTVALPVEVELQFEGGRTERHAWEGRESWTRIDVTRPDRLVAAVVDPDDLLVLDVNRLNNARRVEPDHRTADYWGARLAFWFQAMLGVVGF